jgi:hypothetical protein
MSPVRHVATKVGPIPHMGLGIPVPSGTKPPPAPINQRPEDRQVAETTKGGS